MLKRLFDLFVAALALLLLAPLLLILMLVVRIDSRGPALFRQLRVGRSGAPFRIMKLRTMAESAEQTGPRVTSGNDRRITGAGGWLRRYKLDELPQLWNVLVGEMSFVGPRPEVPEYVRLYPPEVRAVVLSVRPGITDPASLEFFDEAAVLAAHADADLAYRELILPRKLALYCEYVRHRSLSGDLRLIWLTVLTTLGVRRASPQSNPNIP